MPRVNIVGGGFEYASMFRHKGWTIVNTIEEADLVQFTGGEDVSPELYQHTKHPYTNCNPMRDRKEVLVYKACRQAGKNVAGICRGGQFLNVMCGGKMIQHCDNHAFKEGHTATDTRTGECFLVSSTHHQMMIPNTMHGKVIVVARETEHCEKHIDGKLIRFQSSKMQDTEAVWYPLHKTFCFQPHPEFLSWPGLADKYFDYLYEFFGLKSYLLIPDSESEKKLVNAE